MQLNECYDVVSLVVIRHITQHANNGAKKQKGIWEINNTADDSREIPHFPE